MNLTLTNLNQPAQAAKSATPAANETGSPITPDVAGAAVESPGTPAQDGAQPAPAQPALAFAQWLGLEQIIPAPPGAVAARPENAAPEADEIAAETTAAEQQNADAPLLGAMTMSMPMMPVAQTTLAALAAALPGVPLPKASAPAADTDVSLPAGTASSKREGRADFAGLPAAAPALTLAETPVQPAPGAASKAGAPVAPPAETLAALRDAPQDQAAPGPERGAAHTAGVQAPAAGTSQRTADTVTLSGPPTAWRQTLQEALGERMQLQVGKNAEQAVIRLDPPMLGRVEIAIRHSAGSLEVHITATHGEVLRQLQSVSEGLRNDLAQRQFTDVAVNIAPAPRGANGAPMFAGGEGRGRQQDGREQEQDPGTALAEANTGTSPFSLNGRGQGRS
ncbi:flagellar hook-length control protein FliK [Massilia sp. CMS3.1]|uniref:flagellar hook-length control protein FliK n=1 Tax=Massilia sp. CMS3.1 TaxID=3373083 RepID=UPI003EE554AA